MESPQLSIQLYTVRQALEADRQGTLDRLAKTGFRSVEVYNFVDDAAGLRADLDAAGLAAPSGHARFLAEPEAADRMFDAAATVGITTLIDPIVPTERWTTRDDVAATAATLNALVDRAADRGIRLGYHNHSQEFAHAFDDVSAFETFAALLDPRVVLEVDLFWAAIGGQDVPALLGRLGDRVRLLHVKDGILGEDPFRSANPGAVVLDQRVAGTGEVPLREALSVATGTEYAIVEFDTFDGDLFDAIDRSAEFLRQQGVK